LLVSNTACSSQVTRILLIIRKNVRWKIFIFRQGPHFSFKTSCSFSKRHVRSVQLVWPLQWLSCAGVLPCVNKNAQILTVSSQFLTTSLALASALPSIDPACCLQAFARALCHPVFWRWWLWVKWSTMHEGGGLLHCTSYFSPSSW